MTYPVNEKEFVNMWLVAIGDPDNADRELIMAITRTLNKAYYSGLEVGRKEAATCKE